MPSVLRRIAPYLPSRFFPSTPTPYQTLSLPRDPSGLTPWSFFLSYYGIVLFCVSLLTNRIWAVVRPAGPMDQRSAENQHDRPGEPSWKILLKNGLTSRRTHKLLRLPSLLYIVFAIYQMTLLLLPPASSSPWVSLLPFLDRTLSTPTDKLFKRVFTSVSVGLVTGTFSRSLEGFAHVGSQFNMFSFGFLLHLYANPLMHPSSDRRENSRPDWNILFVIWLMGVQFAWLHASECSRRWGRNKLLPTTVCGSIQIAHFTYLLLTSPSSLPAFSFASNLFTLFHFTILTVTLVLSFITQLLTRGTITPSSLLPISNWPATSEDFPTALLKLSSACLNHTKIGGLGNEVGLIEAPSESYVDLSNSSFAREPGYPQTEVFIASSTSTGGFREGFSHEITKIKPTSYTGLLGSWDGEDESPYWNEVRGFTNALRSWLGALAWWALCWVPGGKSAWGWGVRMVHYGGNRRVIRSGRWWFRLQPILADGEHLEGAALDDGDEAEEAEQYTTEDEEDEYQTFLSGGFAQTNDVSELEDPTFNSPVYSTRSRSLSVSSCSSSSSASSTSTTQLDDPLSTISMLPPSPTLPTVLLAHMTSSSASPLTRRRFNALLPSSPSQEASHLRQVIHDKRNLPGSPRAEPANEEQGRTCVICRCEERSVILWPCRCLAVCNDCRETLASRGPAALHSCPCCRTKVEGFSRIYIP